MADDEANVNKKNTSSLAIEEDDTKDGKVKSKHRPPPFQITNDPNLDHGGGEAKTPTSQTPHTPGGPYRSDTFRDKEKIGHRRVDHGGKVTYKKIGTNQIMESIQLGIQQAVGSLAGKPDLDVLIQDFYVVETITFPGAGSQSTPAHPFSDYRFKVYAPIAFRHFRDLFKIAPDDYLISLAAEPLRELSNPGASGSIFYLTNDDEFIIKTVQHKEAEFLQKLLPGYYMNLNQNPKTLLPKFFGLYTYQCNAKNIRLIVMNNLLPTTIKMHQRYDLKGSTYKRKASKYERSKPSPTFKDLDFMEHHPEGILLEAETYKALIKTIERDIRVLASFKIMDYSLLVGIHNLDLAAKEKAQKNSCLIPQSDKANGGGEAEEVVESGPTSCDGGALVRSRSINRHKLVAHSTAMESIQANADPIDEEDHVPPGGIPARNVKGERLLLFLGVIDILQSYRLKKKLEHTVKSMIHDGDTISVHHPTFYAQRFQKFMAGKVFKKIHSPLRHSPSRRRGLSMRMTRPMSQSEPEQQKEEPQKSGVSTSSHQESPVATEPSETSTTPAPTQVKVTIPVEKSVPAVTASVTAVPISVTDSGGTSPAPVNLPGVLQDRPHSGRGRMPPPVPPRSPRGGRSGCHSASFSLGSGRGHHLVEGGYEGGHSPAPRSSPRVHIKSSHVTTVAIQDDRADVVRVSHYSSSQS